MRSQVRQLRGVEAISVAMDQGCEIGLLLLLEGAEDPALVALVERARASGVAVRAASESVLRRMNSVGEPAPVLALVGRRPQEDLESALARGGAFWLLAGVAYPTNVGVAIRTAEGSGATGIAIEAAFDHDARRAALRSSMRADWYMPVFWDKAERVLERARQAGYRIVGIENCGQQAPWELDLTGSVLLIIGGEAGGIPAALLDACDDVVRVPMGGFIPSYNLQIPVGVVASERLRQLESPRARAGLPATAQAASAVSGLPALARSEHHSGVPAVARPPGFEV